MKPKSSAFLLLTLSFISNGSANLFDRRPTILIANVITADKSTVATTGAGTVEKIVDTMCYGFLYGSCEPRILPPLAQYLPMSVTASLAALHEIRYKSTKLNETVFTWEENYRILNSSGHVWCSIWRDNHACFGARYARILSITTPFQGNRYNLSSFKSSTTRILAVGNSHLLELLYLPICASSKFVVKGYHLRGNSFIIHAFDSNLHRETIFLILDNDVYFADGSEVTANKTVAFLQHVQFTPSHIVLGSINGGREKCSYRSQIY